MVNIESASVTARDCALTRNYHCLSAFVDFRIAREEASSRFETLLVATQSLVTEKRCRSRWVRQAKKAMIDAALRPYHGPEEQIFMIVCRLEGDLNLRRSKNLADSALRLEGRHA